MHKNTKMLPYQRREAYRRWRDGDKATDLAKYYHVTRKTLYEVFKKAKLDVFENYSSKNLRYRTLEFGLKQLKRTETKIAKKLAKREHRLNRYQKSHPGEMVHTDSSMLPWISGEAATTPKEYLYVFIDDYSRTLFADILPDQTSYSAAIVLDALNYETSKTHIFSMQQKISHAREFFLVKQIITQLKRLFTLSNFVCYLKTNEVKAWM